MPVPQPDLFFLSECAGEQARCLFHNRIYFLWGVGVGLLASP
ncbi:hypothetical protein QUB28_07085 [Microcoleus sp. B4-C3]